MRRGIVAAAALGTALVMAGPATAGAAPVKAKKATRFEVRCEKLGDHDVVKNGNGIWSAVHIIGSNRKLKAYDLRFSGTFTPKNGAPEPVEEHRVKPAPKSRKLDVCEFRLVETDGRGTLEIEGTAKVTYSGKRLP
jgi:hypothetical protein